MSFWYKSENYPNKWLEADNQNDILFKYELFTWSKRATTSHPWLVNIYVNIL